MCWNIFQHMMNSHKMMLRYIQFISLCIIGLFICSCVSSANLYILPSSNGEQLLFVRPSELKINDFIIEKLSFDMTIHVKENIISDDSIFNYSLELDKTKIASAKNITIKLVLGDEKISLTQNKILYKKPVGEKIIIRYSALLSRQNIDYILHSGKDLQIELDYDGYIINVNNLHNFNRQLDDVRLILL